MILDEHRALLEAAVAGRADEAATLLKAHFQRTAQIILEPAVGGSPKR